MSMIHGRRHMNIFLPCGYGAGNMDPIVHSLLETDLYKFTMWQALLHQYPAAQAEYELDRKSVV